MRDNGKQRVHSGPRKIFSLAIASSGTTSDVLDLGEHNFIGYIAPSGWDTGTLTIQVSVDGTNFVSVLYDELGQQVNLVSTLTTSAARQFNLAAFLGFRYIKLVSSVTQTATRTFSIITRSVA